MAEWPQNQDYNRIVIATNSPESIGTELCVLNTAATNPAWGIAAFAIFTPFVVYQPFTAVKMGVANGPTVSGNIDVGIYDDQGNRIVSKGTTAHANASTVQSFDITDTTLRPGVYFMACVLDNTVGTVTKWVSSTVYQPTFGVYGALTSFVLPASVSFINAGTNGFPQMMVTGRTVV